MSLLRRGENVPKELAELIERGDHVLAWTVHNGGLLAATKRSLISIDHHEPNRIPWETTLQAKWDEPILIVLVQPDSSSAATQMAWSLPEPGQLPAVVRDRVTGTVLVDQVRDVAGVGRVRFVARRGTQAVSWVAIPDDDSVVKAQGSAEIIQAALAEIQAIFGI